MSSAVQRLRETLRRNRTGVPIGIFSVCSAHPVVIRASLRRAQEHRETALIEATCNQVNHLGGYTGMTPATFRRFVLEEADAAGLDAGAIMLGGDHLGPNPWRNRPAAEAMREAVRMVQAYAKAGFAKLHLDASMACAGDPIPLPAETIAARAAELCAAAEAARPPGTPAPLYVIGTEVPTPGGGTEAEEVLTVTRPEDFQDALEIHRAAFQAHGVADAFQRVIAAVVQPGVEFAHAHVTDFQPELTYGLTSSLSDVPDLVFEAHSTDYQRDEALRALVAGHFAILKVGPELTFALREAAFALDAIDAELFPADGRAALRQTIDAAMVENPQWWAGYYHGDAHAQRLARAFSLSDRIRYYWTEPSVVASFDRLLSNLRRAKLPLTLLSQYLPHQYTAIRNDALSAEPMAIIEHHVRRAVDRYARACSGP
jgi:D-tagatose-1,6-bisphosphate aldolase subunit GatZ/KbaZ